MRANKRKAGGRVVLIIQICVREIRAMDVSLLRLNRFSHTAVRLLRRLLEDTIREQHGQQLFDHIEETRRRSVGQHRDLYTEKVL